MGKRELVLIVAFIFVGTLLYQATAPPPQNGGFSWRGMVQNLRKHVTPRHEYLADERTQRLALASDTAEIRIAGIRSLHIEGTDGTVATATFQVYSTGTNEAEARALGKRTALKTSTAGGILSIDVDYPSEERQRAAMTLTVPRTLRVRVAAASNIEATGIAGIELDNTRGDATLTNITGAVRGTHTGGELVLETVKHVDLTARRSDITIKNVAGDLRLDLTGGQLVARNIAGSVKLDANRVSLELDAVGGALTADVTRGSLEVTRLTGQARVEARGTELRLELEKAAAITATTTDENISIRLPAQAGVTLDASVDDGEIRVPESAPRPTTAGQTSIARGPINGGGPTLALRTTHGDIVIR
jgi:putative adhesin